MRLVDKFELSGVVKDGNHRYKLQRVDGSPAYVNLSDDSLAFGGVHGSIKTFYLINDRKYLHAYSHSNNQTIYAADNTERFGGEYDIISELFNFKGRPYAIVKCKQEDMHRVFTLGGKESNLFGFPHYDFKPDFIIRNKSIIPIRHEQGGKWSLYNSNGIKSFGENHHKIFHMQDYSCVEFAFVQHSSDDTSRTYFSRDGVEYVSDDVELLAPVVAMISGRSIDDRCIEYMFKDAFTHATHIIKDYPNYFDKKNEKIKFVNAFQNSIKSILSRNKSDKAKQNQELETMLTCVKRKVKRDPEEFMDEVMAA